MSATTVKGAVDPRIVEEFNRRAPFALTEENLLVLAHVGSHSHGTYVPPTDPQAIDDVDFMGVVIPPVEYVLGIESWEGMNFMRDELDVVFYSFAKFVRLLVKSNPNVLGLLWMRDQDYLAFGPLWKEIRGERDAFSSLEAYNSFLGYAHAQLKKMTAFDEKTTRQWDNAVEMVTAAGWSVDDVTAKNAALPMPDYAAMNRRYSKFSASPETWNQMLKDSRLDIERIHAKHFQGYMGAKRKALVRQYGYDTKNAAHLIRLMRMCVEFLKFGTLSVYRTDDADEIRRIKAGRWTLKAVQDEAEHLFTLAHVVKASSPLPEKPDRERINRLLVEMQLAIYETVLA